MASEMTVEEQILELAKKTPDGFSTDTLKTELPNIPIADQVPALNKLLKENHFDIFKKDGKLFYKLNVNKRTTIKGVDNEEKIVFRLIEEAGNKGIWIRDIRHNSNLTLIQLNKILKSLETRKLIKAVKSVSASKKKVYMLYNLEPDATLTGGAWYQGQDFESEFVELLNQQCYRYLMQKRNTAIDSAGGPLSVRNKCFASLNEIHKFISDSGISNVKLSVEDIDMILNTVVLDGKAQKKINIDGTKSYRVVDKLMNSHSFLMNPCTTCPIIGKCSTIGHVTPLKCEYLSEWLQ